MYARVLVFLMLFVMAGGVVAQDAIPHVEELGVDQDYADAIGMQDTLPDTLDDSMIVNETATSLFSYMKWLFSDNSAQELVGATLAPILLNLYFWFTIAVAFAVLWITIRLLIWTWKLILWFVNWIIRLIELIPGM